jgi:hypothetical protein
MSSRTSRIAKYLLWIDCTGGLVVGTVVLMFSSWLSTLYRLPVSLVIAMGVANLAYGGFSLSLARRSVRPRGLLLLLVAANVFWGLLCAAVLVASRASTLGLAQLIIEGAYVGGLGILEWRHRVALETAA